MTRKIQRVPHRVKKISSVFQLCQIHKLWERIKTQKSRIHTELSFKPLLRMRLEIKEIQGSGQIDSLINA